MEKTKNKVEVSTLNYKAFYKNDANGYELTKTYKELRVLNQFTKRRNIVPIFLLLSNDGIIYRPLHMAKSFVSVQFFIDYVKGYKKELKKLDKNIQL